jgi:AraC family transcriptional regulator, regulatory protein of adaptative response / methylated-DNA-[protein]-cysteine methyltransferase
MGIVAEKPESALDEAAPRDFERITRAIAYLRRHAAHQPELSDVARHLNLSEHHFQRLFTRWAGVSPKRFLQFLTLEHAKARLAHAASLLELAGDVGLSGPGRLHDLFITLEALSPGEFKAGGAGLTIRVGTHASPFGECVIATTRRGICGLHFIDSGADAAAAVRADWPNAEIIRNDAATAPLARRIFEPLALHRAHPLAVIVKGTNFQLQVWRALLALPFGALEGYGGVADAIGRPAAARAVGAAIGANAVAWLIPCHRVIRGSGALSGYRWGPDRKAAMLGWEAVRAGMWTD